MMKLIGILLLAVLAYLYFTGQLTRRKGMSLQEARAVLGVEVGVEPDAIQAAHRRIIAQVHPDKGGSADLAARVNEARDVLLKERIGGGPGSA